MYQPSCPIWKSFRPLHAVSAALHNTFCAPLSLPFRVQNVLRNAASLSRAFSNSKADAIVGTLDREDHFHLVHNHAIFMDFAQNLRAGLSTISPLLRRQARTSPGSSRPSHRRRLRAHPTRLLPVSVHEVLCCVLCVFAVGRVVGSEDLQQGRFIPCGQRSATQRRDMHLGSRKSARWRVLVPNCQLMNVDVQVWFVFDFRGVADDVFSEQSGSASSRILVRTFRIAWALEVTSPGKCREGT